MAAVSAAEVTHWQQLPQAPQPGCEMLPLAALPDGAAQLFAFPDTGFSLLLLRTGEVVLAYVNRCPHFGIPLAARQEHLLYASKQSLSCNVHYARFRWQDGFCEAGDCRGETLLAVPLVVRDGLVCIAP